LRPTREREGLPSRGPTGVILTIKGLAVGSIRDSRSRNFRVHRFGSNDVSALRRNGPATAEEGPEAAKLPGALAFPGALGGSVGGNATHIIKQRGADGRKFLRPLPQHPRD
jgi:hypothetical protein